MDVTPRDEGQELPGIPTDRTEDTEHTVTIQPGEPGYDPGTPPEGVEVPDLHIDVIAGRTRTRFLGYADIVRLADPILLFQHITLGLKEIVDAKGHDGALVWLVVAPHDFEERRGWEGDNEKCCDSEDTGVVKSAESQGIAEWNPDVLAVLKKGSFFLGMIQLRQQASNIHYMVTSLLEYEGDIDGDDLRQLIHMLLAQTDALERAFGHIVVHSRLHFHRSKMARQTLQHIMNRPTVVLGEGEEGVHKERRRYGGGRKTPGFAEGGVYQSPEQLKKAQPLPEDCFPIGTKVELVFAQGMNQHHGIVVGHLSAPGEAACNIVRWLGSTDAVRVDGTLKEVEYIIGDEYSHPEHGTGVIYDWAGEPQIFFAETGTHCKFHEIAGELTFARDAHWAEQALATAEREGYPPREFSALDDLAKVLFAAIQRLVNLKDYKDTQGKDERYEREQPQAWEQARQAIAAVKPFGFGCEICAEEVPPHQTALTTPTGVRHLRCEDGTPRPELGPPESIFDEVRLIHWPDDETVEAQYKSNPVTITARKLTEEVKIETTEGTMTGNVGDWLITGTEGEQYPCKDVVFRKKYRPAPAVSSTSFNYGQAGEETKG